MKKFIIIAVLTFCNLNGAEYLVRQYGLSTAENVNKNVRELKANPKVRNIEVSVLPLNERKFVDKHYRENYFEFSIDWDEVVTVDDF